jgi:hypothetical protein
MSKIIRILFYTCVFFILSVKGNAQEINNDSVNVEVILSNAMLQHISMNIKFINSIDYTVGDYLLLASSNQFYILGMGGIIPVFGTSNKKIDAYTVTSKGTLFAIIGKELCIIDSHNKLTKLLTLPNNAMGITSGNECLYVFDKNNLNGKNSIYTKLGK